MNQGIDRDTRFQLQGPVGELETWVVPSENNPHHAIAVICHPHPLHGGTMTNKVVTTLANTFRDMGVTTVRFNFRGVGKSEGHYAEGNGEQDDLLAVMAWVKHTYPEKEIWLAGFSFGAYVSVKVASTHPVARLISVAIPVSWQGLIELAPITFPWVVVQGDQDEIVDPEKVYRWINTLPIRPHLIRLPMASHFFHGQLLVLREQLKAYLQS